MRSNASRGTLRIVVSLLIILGIAVWAAQNARAQVTGATLTGTVTDSSGAIIPVDQETTQVKISVVVQEFRNPHPRLARMSAPHIFRV